MKLFALLTLFPLLLAAAPGEIPKELRVAEEMMKDGLGRDAATRIQDWLQKNNFSPQPLAQVMLAEALLLDHRPAESLSSLPKTCPPELLIRQRLTRAAALAEVGRSSDAVLEWQEAKKEAQNPEIKTQIRLGLAETWLHENNPTAAIRELVEVLDDPKNPSHDLARLFLVKVLLSEGKSDEASDALEKISPKSPGPILAEAMYWKARLLAVRGKADEARTLFEKVIEDRKNATRDLISQAWIAIGQIDRARDKPADAASAFEKALDCGGNPESYLTAAREYLSAAKTAQSLPAASLRLRDSVRDRESDDEKRGRYAPALLLLASSSLDSENLEASVADLDNLMKTYPSSPALPSAQLLLAEALVKQGQLTTAREQLQSLLKRENLSSEITYQGKAALPTFCFKREKPRRPALFGRRPPLLLQRQILPNRLTSTQRSPPQDNPIRQSSEGSRSFLQRNIQKVVVELPWRWSAVECSRIKGTHLRAVLH